MSRKKYVLGNWKLNKNLDEVTKFFSTFNKTKLNTKIVYGFAPVGLYLQTASKLKKGNCLVIAQDVSEQIEGSYTGQVSCKQLKDFKVKHAIVGHSETRKFLGCDDKVVNAKVTACLNNGITPIICIGESLQQYKAKLTKKVLTKQINTIFKGINANNATKCIIAYEPLWAIGTGLTPTTKEISNLCGYIRKVIKQLFNTNIANKLPILYGGSVNDNNALNIIKLNDVDGLLIGGASLCPAKMIKIIKNIDIWLTKK